MATRTVRKSFGTGRRAPLLAVTPEKNLCLEIEDHSSTEQSAVSFFGLQKGRGIESTAARLAEQFVRQNRSLVSKLDASLEHRYDGSEVRIRLTTGSAVGAIPLISPTTARHDYGLVVQPRFPWAGIGPMLGAMGWRVAPVPLKLPLLRRSERRVPPWVLSSMILPRIEALLRSMTRRFEVNNEILHAPRGRVDWAAYATRHLACARAMSVPCSFPDLKDDSKLLGAIRHTLEQQIRSLDTQRHHGAFVLALIDMASSLHQQVRKAPTYVPTGAVLGAWLQRPLRGEHFQDGIQAIEWTVDERGLAGLSDLDGLPWTLPMETFFEAWIETVLKSVAERTGGTIKTGRNRETVYPIRWIPQFLGSQRSLIPDIWMNLPDTTLIVDAKYKRHWEELQYRGWQNVVDVIREDHRDDLLQVLAYANLASTRNVIACLAFPCSLETWKSMQERGRLFHRGDIQQGERNVQLWLTAIPMHANVDDVAAPIAAELRRHLADAA